MTSRRVILWFLAVAPLIALAILPFSIPAAIGIVFISHMLVLYPTLRATSQWLGPVVTSFETAAREVWLTIDDGPDARDTPAILDALDRHGARATFFVKGERARAHPELLLELQRRGHAIGNHSDTHPSGSFWCLPPRRIAAEIDGCSKAIRAITGTAPGLFRAPVGMKNPFVHPLLSSRGLTLIAWSARAFDAVRNDVPAILARLRRRIRPGAIILLHESGNDSSASSSHVEVVEGLLKQLRNDSYSCVIPDPSRFVYGRRKVSR